MTNALASKDTRFPRALFYAAPVAALLYPLLLVALFRAGQTTGAIRGLALFVTLALVFAVPAIAFAVIRRSGAGDDPSVATHRLRVAAHLAFAAPPLYTFIGVLTYMAGLPNGDYWAWVIIWPLAIIWLSLEGTGPVDSRGAPKWLAPAHGTVAVTVIAGFVLLHFFNHLTGLWSAETHIAVMKVLRGWYRNGFVEPVLVALMLFMAGSGFVLLRARLTRGSDFFGTVQTATAAYLLFFIPGHMNSVFIYQRWFAGKESDFWFASGGAAGLLGDGWSVRLIPHYLVGVWALTTHAACGLRYIMLTRGVERTTANRIAIAISTAGAIAATAMVLALCRVHIVATTGT
ncbi:MAG: hypothetical protein ABI771_08575 [Betaproteobacteria bacterium]